MESFSSRSSSSAAGSRMIRVYDFRFEGKKVSQQWLETSGLDINDFIQLLRKKFQSKPNEIFVLVTTDRIVVDYDKFNQLKDDSTLYLLRHEHQELPASTEENIKFTPHYHTLTEGGLYEYHASMGNSSLSVALAELIDNSLSATANNKGVRTIHIQMMLDGTMGKPAVIVIDNGCGMTSKKMNNWAVYKLSKFKREDSMFSSHHEGYAPPAHVKRSVNSDMSFFGVGGKHASFFIGNAVRMISKPAGYPDVHELLLSEEGLEKKARSKEDVFKGTIKNRKPGDSSHLEQNQERFLHDVIAEELGKESFTTVVISGIRPEFINYIKKEFDALTRQLAHIYHYYIHGVNGNDLKDTSRPSDEQSKIDIQVTLREKPPQCPRAINLREVEDDVQTLYITSAADTFEFRASTVPDNATVEGLIRYHPFLYDKETYPQDTKTGQVLPLDDDDDDNEVGVLNQARGKRPIFECFWNGRLIPSTTVSEFDWCSVATKGVNVPAECFNRISGVLFSDDGFKVTQNKLFFMDLELKLRKKDTIFTTVSSGQKISKRGNIQKEFITWLQNCHLKYDKQIKFTGCMGTVERTDGTKKTLQTWTKFSAIEWDGKEFKAEQHVKSLRTQPILYGKVVHFLLRGNHYEDVFATGGQVEISQEPVTLYNVTRVIPISKIDTTATIEAIKKNISADALKLPKRLSVEWPEGEPWPQNAVCPAGTPLGPLKIEILNGKGEPMSKIPSGGSGTKLSLMLVLTEDGPDRNTNSVQFVAQHSPKFGFWFKKRDDIIKRGKYTLSLKAFINENVTSFVGKALPSHTLKFTITAREADAFMLGVVSPSVLVGAPFNISLEIRDCYGHPAVPPLHPVPSLTCSGLDLSHTRVDSTESTITIVDVKAKGKIPKDQRSESYELTVTLPGLRKDTQTIKIELSPGAPHSLNVMPKEEPIKVENGKAIIFKVKVLDEAGNITAHKVNRQSVRCQVQGFPAQTLDCRSSGTGNLLTKPINVKIIKGEPQTLEAVFELPTYKTVMPVKREVTVLPSTRVTRMELRNESNDENLVFKDNEKIDWLAGSLLENLFYCLYDEAGKDVQVTHEIASKIKVNWTRNLKEEELLQGKLPSIKVPEHVNEERFYQVSYQDQSVSVSFTVTPRPDEPAQLRVSPSEITVQLGVPLTGEINLELVDQYGNLTKTLTPSCVKQMTVKADGLDKSATVFKWKRSGGHVVLTRVRFQGGALGPREMWLGYTDKRQRVIVNVTAGLPAQLSLVGETGQPLQFLNGKISPTHFELQLLDEWGNISNNQSVVVKLKISPPGLTVLASETSQLVSQKGKASFVVTSVSGPKGYYQLTFQGSFNQKVIPGPSVTFTLIPDPNKPVKLLVQYNSKAKFPAGGHFPVFSVKVVSDEGSPITTFNPGAVVMLVWEGGPSGDPPPDHATKMRCSKPLESDKNDCFYFREKQIPERVGNCVIQFSLKIDRDEVLFSDQILLKVVANQPVKLGPESQPPNPVVSCGDDIDSRTLVKNMTLRIMDEYGNPAGQNLNGTLVVSITDPKGESDQELPVFERNSSTVQFDLIKGTTHIPMLAIKKTSPGHNGWKYNLVFRPEVLTFLTPLAPFELPFHFYNNADNQRMMSELTKKQSDLNQTLTAYKEMFRTCDSLLALLTKQALDANQKEKALLNELHKKNVTIPPSASSSSIDELIQKRTAEAERVQHMRKRVCSIPDPFRGSQDVLGKVGHLAVVQEDNVARIISWYISGLLDCVVTKTTEAAQKIYKDTHGAQQVLALDSVFVSRENRPLPHIRNGRKMFEPPGNPVMARELLIYPQHEESSDKVFKNLLGDTIVMDNLNSANQYRRMVVKNHMPCPTILTRDGIKVNAKGIFGGAQNKAPPMEKLKLLGAPFPEEYHKLEKEKELLIQYQTAMKKRAEAEAERDEHLNKIRSPEHKMKQQEMANTERQLEEIKRQYVQARSVRRTLEDVPESSAVPVKRARK